jgi:hypothetical protein
MKAEHETLEINKGDTINAVKQKLGLVEEPERLREGDKLTFHYHLAELGFWVFFNESGIAYSIRFDHPFPYLIKGIRIGDTKDHVLAVLGKPQRYLPIPDSKNRWIYDKEPRIRVDFNSNSERVEKIFRI